MSARIDKNTLPVNRIQALLNTNHRSQQKINMRGYERAGVLIPFFHIDNEWKLLLTRRTEYVQTHKGQVAFPGGAFDPEDENIVETALRESCEEIGLCSNEVSVLGCLEDQITVSSFVITPVVAYVEKPFNIVISKNEVSRVFCIPLTWLAEPIHRRKEVMLFPDGKESEVIFYQLYEGELLWGVTANIIIKLLDTLGLKNKKQ